MYAVVCGVCGVLWGVGLGVACAYMYMVCVARWAWCGVCGVGVCVVCVGVACAYMVCVGRWAWCGVCGIGCVWSCMVCGCKWCVWSCVGYVERGVRAELHVWCVGCVVCRRVWVRSSKSTLFFRFFSPGSRVTDT